MHNAFIRDNEDPYESFIAFFSLLHRGPNIITAHQHTLIPTQIKAISVLVHPLPRELSIRLMTPTAPAANSQRTKLKTVDEAAGFLGLRSITSATRG
jgi:hypothetical protein